MAEADLPAHPEHRLPEEGEGPANREYEVKDQWIMRLKNIL